MLYEDDVVLATCTHLEAHGWTIVSRCLGRTSGDYIVAQRGEARLLVECKGETSQDPRTRKYGQSFSPNQAYDHVSKAVLRCLRVTSRSDGLAAVAVPENAMHLKIISEGVARAGPRRRGCVLGGGRPQRSCGAALGGRHVDAVAMVNSRILADLADDSEAPQPRKSSPTARFPSDPQHDRPHVPLTVQGRQLLGSDDVTLRGQHLPGRAADVRLGRQGRDAVRHGRTPHGDGEDTQEQCNATLGPFRWPRSVGADGAVARVVDNAPVRLDRRALPAARVDGVGGHVPVEVQDRLHHLSQPLELGPA